jgi:hypothetical protein
MIQIEEVIVGEKYLFSGSGTFGATRTIEVVVLSVNENVTYRSTIPGVLHGACDIDLFARTSEHV